VEDDAELARLISEGLRRSGFAVDVVGSCVDTEFALSVTRYDCVVADRGLPDGDAAKLVEELRAGGFDTPVLFLTALGSIEDRVMGFEHGADDYLVKPFVLSELVLRVQALTRRRAPVRAPIIRLADLDIDLPRRRVSRSGVLLALTAKEFAVLDVLAERPGTIITRSELIERCWDESTEPMSNVVDVLIAQLRRKLGPPPLIRTIRGTGYCLEEPQA
jgi:two-component system copper resistance phosphate regulon response regulator CusR